jgi:hypothetical protein
MSTNTIVPENGSNAPAAKPKREGKVGKKAKSPKKAGTAKKTAKPNADRANKKAEVIAMMQRTKAATLAEIT